jgi:multidrug efflux pump subunit AcrB
VSQALALLPQEVQALGVTVQAESTNLLLVIAVYSPDQSKDALFLSNFATINVQDELARVTASARRISSAPGLLDAYLAAAGAYGGARHLAAGRQHAIEEQNMQAALGSVGGPPIERRSGLQYTIVTEGQLITPEEFGQIVVRTGDDGGVVRITTSPGSSLARSPTQR